MGHIQCHEKALQLGLYNKNFIIQVLHSCFAAWREHAKIQSSLIAKASQILQIWCRQTLMRGLQAFLENLHYNLGIRQVRSNNVS